MITGTDISYTVGIKIRDNIFVPSDALAANASTISTSSLIWVCVTVDIDNIIPETW